MTVIIHRKYNEASLDSYGGKEGVPNNAFEQDLRRYDNLGNADRARPPVKEPVGKGEDFRTAVNESGAGAVSDNRQLMEERRGPVGVISLH